RTEESISFPSCFKASAGLGTGFGSVIASLAEGVPNVVEGTAIPSAGGGPGGVFSTFFAFPFCGDTDGGPPGNPADHTAFAEIESRNRGRLFRFPATDAKFAVFMFVHLRTSSDKTEFTGPTNRHVIGCKG